MSKIPLFCILLVISIQCSYSQNKQITDSLLNLLEKSNLEIEEQFEVYCDLAHYHTDFQEGLQYAERALSTAVQLVDSFKIAKALEGIGLINRLLGNKKISFNAAFEASNIYKRLNKVPYLAASYTQIGSNYIVDKEYTSAVDYLSRALDIYQNVVIDSFRQSLTHINIGEAYRLAHKLDSSSLHFSQALVLNESLKDDAVEGYALGNLGMVHVAQGKFDQGIEEMQRAIGILNELGDVYSISIYEAEIGKTLFQHGQYQVGIHKVKAAMELAESNHLKEQMRDFSEMLVDFYQSMGDYERAFYYQQQYQVYQDSLVNKENIQKTEQLKSQYEIDKRESEISFLSKTNEAGKKISYALAGGVGLFVVLSALLYHHNRQKQKANAQLVVQKQIVKNREEEKGLLLRELNHRVKNNLQMVSSLMNLQLHKLKDHPSAEMIRSGKFRVEAMSMIHQKLYSQDHTTQIAFKEYIEELTQNLVYSYNQGVRLVLKVVPVQLSIDLAIPLALIINELVTNALKYAFDSAAEVDPIVELSLYSDNQELYLKVNDNGAGMNEKENIDAFGLQLVHSLVDQIDGEISMTNEKGVFWTLKVPLV